VSIEMKKRSYRGRREHREDREHREEEGSIEGKERA
jgi:hypothetical protein